MGCGHDDPTVGLVGNESIDVVALQAVAGKDFLAHLGLLADSKFEHRLSILMDEVHPLFYSFLAGGMQAPSGRHVERTTSGAVHFVHKVDQTFGIIFGGLEKDGAGSIAKDHTGSTVG